MPGAVQVLQLADQVGFSEVLGVYAWHDVLLVVVPLRIPCRSGAPQALITKGRHRSTRPDATVARWPPVRCARTEGLPPLGVLPRLGRDPLGTCWWARERYGDVVRLPVPRGSVYLLAHPDHVEQVLVNHNPNHWKGHSGGRTSSSATGSCGATGTVDTGSDESCNRAFTVTGCAPPTPTCSR